MRILGIDPGLRVTGYGVVDQKGGAFELIEAGLIKSAASDGISRRLGVIHRGIKSLVGERKPDIAVLEKLYSHYRHPTTALLMGHARGVICLALEEDEVPLVSLPATRVRKSILSNGHASKEQIQRAVQHLLHLRRAPHPVDVSDALALAISFGLTHAKRCTYGN